MRIAHVAPSFFPATAFGGPIFSTKAICDGTATLDDVEIRVLTSEAASNLRGDNLDLVENPARFEEGYEVKYCRRIAGASVSVELLWQLPKYILWADIVHLTATYSFPTLPTLLCAKLLRKPVIWSPRGALQASSEWSEAPNQLLKVIFEKMCSIARPKNTLLHVTSIVEEKLSAQRLNGILTAVIPNSVPVPDSFSTQTRSDEERFKLIFLSRLHEKKGLELLINALVDLPECVTLDIYGSGASDYVERLKLKVTDLGLNKRVVFRGDVGGLDKRKAFEQADAFVLPSYSENFGIAIAEALAHAKPVIVTNKTPWADVEKYDCGLYIDASKSALVDAINDIQKRDVIEMGKRGRDWMKHSFSQEATSRQMYEAYTKLCHVTAKNQTDLSSR